MPAHPMPHRTARVDRLRALLGAQLDGFRLDRLVALGGTGGVFRAVEPRGERCVAVKVLDPRGAGTELRFRREIAALSAVSHPHVVVLVGWGEDRGRLFLATEWLDGCSLHRFAAARGPLAPLAALEVCMQVTGALVALHARGFVHRDVKPANVILLPGAAPWPTVKLIDFGAVAWLDPRSARGPLTAPGRSLGTPGFMSPEQARGERVDARADVWGVGRLLGWLTTTGARTATCARLPPVTASLVRFATAADPERRPASAAALLCMLAAARDELRERARRCGLPAGAHEAPTMAVLELRSRLPTCHTQVARAAAPTLRLGAH